MTTDNLDGHAFLRSGLTAAQGWRGTSHPLQQHVIFLLMLIFLVQNVFQLE